MSHSPLPVPPRRTVFGRGSYAESLRIGEILRKETVGGALLVVAAAAAIIWANSPASGGYFALRDFTVGYEPWHLRLSLGAWAAGGRPPGPVPTLLAGGTQPFGPIDDTIDGIAFIGD